MIPESFAAASRQVQEVLDQGGVVALLGYRGSGKTTLGRWLAARLSWGFLDLDRTIEAEAGRTIDTLFAQEGEAAFRRLEARALQEALAGTRQVLAPGGGVVVAENNRQRLRLESVSVYLRVTPEDLIRRLRSSPRRPPLTDLSPDEEVRQVLAKREPWYLESASFTLDVAAAEERARTQARLGQLFGLK
jgi:shikimate kinase